MKINEFSNTSEEIIKLRNFLSKEDLDFYPPLHERGSIEEYMKEMIKGKILYFSDGKIIALTNFFEFYDKYKSAYIKFIAVLPEYRNCHLGSSLVAESLKKLEKTKEKKITITTWSTNESAINLYKKFGFKICDRIKNERGNEVDTLILTKSLRR